MENMTAGIFLSLGLCLATCGIGICGVFPSMRVQGSETRAFFGLIIGGLLAAAIVLFFLYGRIIALRSPVHHREGSRIDHQYVLMVNPKIQSSPQSAGSFFIAGATNSF